MTRPLRVLFVAARHPWPPRRGDQMRADQFVRALAAEHEVVVMTPGGRECPEIPGLELRVYGRDPADRTMGVVRAALSGQPLQAGLFRSRDLERRLRVEAEQYDLVVLQLVRSCGLLPALGTVPLMVDFIDTLSLGFARRAELEAPGWRQLLRLEARRLRRWEGVMLDRAGATCVVSERDRAAMIGDRQHSASRLRVVPLAVERPALSPLSPPGRAQPSRPRLVLSGNLGYFVNRDATRWFLRHVWPRLRAARPGLILTVAGSRAGGLAEVARSAGAEVIENPPDLRAVLAESSVALAPMRCGSGVPVKVLEAWSVGLPVVASPWAAAGVEGRAGEHYLLAEDPDRWQSQILSLLDQPERAARLAENAATLLRERYSQTTFATALDELVELALGRS